MKLRFIFIFADLMYVCNKEPQPYLNVMKFRNSLVSRPLPFLSRSFISFHHLCGYDQSSEDEISHDCAITIEKDSHQEEDYTQGPERPNRTTLLTVPEERLGNHGNVSQFNQWFFEYHQLPRINLYEKIVLKAEFDAKNGGFGLDNIRFHTPQR